MHKPHPSIAVLILTVSFLSFPFIICAQRAGRSAANIARKRFPSVNSSISSEKRKGLSEAQRLKERALQFAYLKKYAEAFRYAERALELKRSILGAEHRGLVEDMVLFGAIYEDGGDDARAEELYKRALAIGEKEFGADDDRNEPALDNLADLYRKLKDYERAEPLYVRLWRMRETSAGARAPEVAETLEALIAVYIAQSKFERAESLEMRAFGIREKQFGAESLEFGKYLLELANLYIGKNQLERAELLYNRALKIYEKNLGADNAEVTNLKNAWNAIKNRRAAKP
jgi:tetratricopeptide (TPR) repeat protein